MKATKTLGNICSYIAAGILILTATILIISTFFPSSSVADSNFYQFFVKHFTSAFDGMSTIEDFINKHKTIIGPVVGAIMIFLAIIIILITLSQGKIKNILEIIIGIFIFCLLSWLTGILLIIGGSLKLISIRTSE